MSLSSELVLPVVSGLITTIALRDMGKRMVPFLERNDLREIADTFSEVPTFASFMSGPVVGILGMFIGELGETGKILEPWYLAGYCLSTLMMILFEINKIHNKGVM